MRIPEGPTAVPFGKECRADKMSKPGTTEIGLVFALGTAGRTAWMLRLQQLPGGIIVGG